LPERPGGKRPHSKAESIFVKAGLFLPGTGTIWGVSPWSWGSFSLCAGKLETASRKGKDSKNFELLPLDFKEFCELAGFKKEIRSKTDLRTYDQELKELFRKYVKTGGFPLVINEILSERKDISWLKDIYYSWIIGDVIKLGKSEKIALQIISSLIKKQPSQLSWDSIAKDSEIKSHLTISSYVDVLESMFVLKANYFYDIEKKTINPSKNKKIHFFDSFIYRLLCKKTKQEPKEEVIYEDIVCFNIFKNLREVFYRYRKKETDFLVVIENKPIGIEVKWQNNISKNDYLSFSNLEKGILITKDIFEIKNINGKKYLAMPIHWFLILDIERIYNMFY
jgi:hypothetical protein